MVRCASFFVFFFQAEDGIRDKLVTGVQTCALPIWEGVAYGQGGLLPAPSRHLHAPLPHERRPGNRRLPAQQGDRADGPGQRGGTAGAAAAVSPGCPTAATDPTQPGRRISRPSGGFVVFESTTPDARCRSLPCP